MSNKVSAVVSFVALGLVAAATSGCIIVRIPPPKKGDAFQPPPSSALAIKRGDTHKFRMTCGAKATFRSDIPNAAGLVVAFDGKNLSPADQQTTATMRMNWNGAGVAMDMPIGVGDKGSRTTKGSITLNGNAGRHEMSLSMDGAPDCGPVNLTLSFR